MDRTGLRLTHAVCVLTIIAFALIACGGSSSSPSSASQPTGAPVTPGGGIGPSDESFCEGDRRLRATCEPSHETELDRRRCREKACERRTTFGQQAGDALNDCLLRRRCGSSHDSCYNAVLGARASSPQVVEAFQRCAPFEQRCGGIATGNGKTSSCALIAQLDPNAQQAFASCFGLPCELGQQCTAGQFARLLQPCQSPR